MILSKRSPARDVSVLALLCAAILIPSTASAFTGEARLGDLSVTAYAPDWIWQDREINILLVARNAGSAPVSVSFELKYPEDGAGYFSLKDGMQRAVDVARGAIGRQGFAGIVALEHTPDGRQAPLGLYEFRLQVSAGMERGEIRYPVTTIRGAAVSPGALAIYLPVGISLAWCVVFYWVLTRWQGRGAWRKYSTGALDLLVSPEWVEETPPAIKGRP